MEKIIIMVLIMVLIIFLLSLPGNMKIEILSEPKSTITQTIVTTTTATTSQKSSEKIPLRFFIDENSGKNLQFFDNSTIADARAALMIWEDRVKVIEFTEVENEKIADIVIKWSSNLTTFPGLKTVGEAWHRLETVSGIVYLLPSGMSCRNQNRAMHEIGHLFGLNHSTNYQSIMYQYESCAQNVTDEDVNAVLKIFGK
jgi:hypothetical protein